MLGRTLTVSRARELNAKDYFYQMLKDNPAKLMWLVSDSNDRNSRKERKKEFRMTPGMARS